MFKNHFPKCVLNIHFLYKEIGTLLLFKEKLSSIWNQNLKIKNQLGLIFQRQTNEVLKIFLHITLRVFLEINLKVREFRTQVFRAVLLVFTELLT